MLQSIDPLSLEVIVLVSAILVIANAKINASACLRLFESHQQ
tara:strand:- start:95 stop:220 length:126 start_codon:yes stop_codon:yes gene_type:complete